MARLIARVRVPLLLLVMLVLFTERWSHLRLPWWLATTAMVGALLVYARIGRMRAQPVPVAPPVRGPWQAVNSPADRVPSHGVHAYGQSYAIDLVYRPAGWPAPHVSWRPLTRPARAYPGFGQPVHAVAAGRVVRVHQGQRDHWSRTSVPALLYLLVEGTLRELSGVGRVLGNHLVLDLGGGRYALYAHLKRGSVTVRRGDRVVAGQAIASCGNSGNSTEPHLHFQIMDRPGAAFAAGLPFTFTGPLDGDLVDGLPRGGTTFTVPAERPSAQPAGAPSGVA